MCWLQLNIYLLTHMTLNKNHTKSSKCRFVNARQKIITFTRVGIKKGFTAIYLSYDTHRVYSPPIQLPCRVNKKIKIGESAKSCNITQFIQWVFFFTHLGNTKDNVPEVSGYGYYNRIKMLIESFSLLPIQLARK